MGLRHDREIIRADRWKLGVDRSTTVIFLKTNVASRCMCNVNFARKFKVESCKFNIWCKI